MGCYRVFPTSHTAVADSRIAARRTALPSGSRGLLAGEPDEIDHLHVECSGEARQGDPGRILFPALYPGYGDSVEFCLGGERFDGQLSPQSKTADSGSKLGKGRLRHGMTSLPLPRQLLNNIYVRLPARKRRPEAREGDRQE